MYVNFRAAKAVMDVRLHQAQSEPWAPGRRYRVVRVRRGWLVTKWHWLLGSLGHQMVVAGKRLEQFYNLPQPSL